MMCLGWKTKPDCAAREQQTVVPPGTMCPSIAWFWAALAAIGIGLVAKKG